MNKRQAQAKALHVAYVAVQKAILSGPEPEEGIADEDLAKVEDALDGIAQRLFERWQSLSD
jgi:hypothetical protein